MDKWKHLFLSLSLFSALQSEDVEELSPSFFSGDLSVALDSFRSLPDGSWSGNNGGFSSLNLLMGLPDNQSKYSAQLGGSYGLYDWNGKGSNPTGNTKAVQQQAFVTTGFSRITSDCSGVNAAIVYDWMWNKQFGVFGLHPILDQVRGQVGYLFQQKNEIGLWGTIRAHTSHQNFSEIPVRFRAISQANLFWTHHFSNQAETMLWAGTPYQRGLMYTSGRAGNYIVGASFTAPLTRSLSIFGHGSYMGSHSGSQSFNNYAANVCFGISYAFGDSQEKVRPYLDLANNSNFLVDTNLNE